MRRPSTGTVLGTIALTLAVGTSGAEAKHLLTGADIKDGSIHKRDLARDARIAGPRGLRGVAGQRGPQGPAGTAGLAAVITRMVVVTKSIDVAPGDINTSIGLLTATCPAGYGAIAGGGAWGGGEAFLSGISGDNGWVIGYDNYLGSITITVTANAHCIQGLTTTFTTSLRSAADRVLAQRRSAARTLR